MTASPPEASPAGPFATLDPTDPLALQAAIDGLLAAPTAEADALAQFLVAAGQLSARVVGEGSRRMVAMNRATDDAQAMQAVIQYQREVAPIWERAADQLNGRLLESAAADDLPPYYAVYRRDAQTARDLYRDENIALGIEEAELGNRFAALAGAAVVEVEGQQLPVPVARQLLQEPDRALRERVWHACMDRASADAEATDDIFDQLVRLRVQIAHNAGFSSVNGGFLAYQFKAMGRHDYRPDDCRRFHDAVEQVIVPALHRVAGMRRARLGLDTLRPWDLAVSLLGEGATQPFAGPGRLTSVARAVFEAVDPSFAADFDRLTEHGRLDLEARTGKAPGAYMSDIADEPLPFIFANATGSRRDLMTLLHEGGHAFHTLLAREQSLMAYRWAPIEFSEVASMSMELLGLDAMQRLPPQSDGAPLVGAADLRELRAEALLNIIALFPMVARLDAFQHEVYAQPDMDRHERRALWARLDARFAPTASWQGLEHVRGLGWHGVPHPFSHPLYFIEYAIAQLGALQLRARAQTDAVGTVAAYRRALRLGGSRPLDALFAAAGARLAFDAASLETLVLPLVDELDAVLGA